MEDDGARLVLMLFPDGDQVGPRPHQPVPQERMRAFARMEGLLLADPLPALRAIGPAAFMDRLHFTPAGSAAVADAALDAGAVPASAWSTAALAEALAPTAAPAPARQLAALLARSDYTVRRQAAWAIGRGGRAAATVTQELTAGSARRLSEDAIAIYRRKRGLLSADQIRSIRESYTLTQAEFGRLLRLGSNSLSRWESGRNVQTEAMDTLLRLIRDVPGSIDYLRSHAA